MSREIDMSNPDAWDDDEVEYLLQRGRLPEGYQRKVQTVDQPSAEEQLANTVNTGDEGDELDLPEELDEDLESMSVAELRERAEQVGVAKSGTKDELIARIREAI